MEFMDRQRELYPDQAELYDTFTDLYSRKLWHQLTEQLLTFLSDKKNCREAECGNSFLNLYNGFISNFQARLSQVKLAQIASYVGSSLASLDPQAAIIFFTTCLENKEKLGNVASLCLEMDLVQTKILLGPEGATEAKSLIEQGKIALHALPPAETNSIVFSKYYKTEADFRKAVGPPGEFFKAALMLLAYTPADSMPQDERYILATDIALAAMTADGVYNFGEVIATPILQVLIGSPNEWMADIVHALHNGSILAFNAVLENHSDKYFSQPALATRHDVVKQKVVLLALMNMAFELHPHKRTISFTDLSRVTGLAVDQAEWVLMRAMSLNLIKGQIDEVAQTIDISWVQPRVLDQKQLTILTGQIDAWTSKVDTMLHTIESQAPELL
jgi:26S proteasome regulatory subunit N9